MPSPTLSPNHLLRLPRELRDTIYTSIIHSLEFSTSEITTPSPFLTQILTRSNTHVAAELLETYFAHITICTDFAPDSFPNAERCWGPHTPLAKSRLQCLVVEAKEPLQTASSVREFELLRARNSRDRRMWASLLEMPRLKELDVRMQKSYGDDDVFSWMPFAPVLYELREKQPQLEFKFHMSFDDVLQKAARDPYWDIPEFRATREYEYEHMGYVDVSELFEWPSKQDWDFVAEYESKKKKKKADSRSIRRDFYLSPEERREMVLCNVAEEPALLRVQMWEGWRVWKEFEEKRKNKEKEKVRQE